MTGYHEGHMAVEFYKGAWVLRAALAADRPITESPDAQAAMALWRERNRIKREQSLQENSR